MPAKWNLGLSLLPLAVVASVYISFLFAALLLLQLYPVTAQTLNYALICIGAITIVSVADWIFPEWGQGTLVQGPDQDDHGRGAEVCKSGEGGQSECGRGLDGDAKYDLWC